jgi:hypothetical protein
MGMKPRVTLEVELSPDPWYTEKPETYSCPTPWSEDKVGMMPGILRYAGESGYGREMWAVVEYLSGCGHWIAYEKGELCGEYITRKSAESALLWAGAGVCFNCMCDVMGIGKGKEDGIQESK